MLGSAIMTSVSTLSLSLSLSLSVNLTGQVFVHGDACNIAVHASDSLDLITTVYTLRNFPDLQSALSEMVRVLKPGGMIVILDAFPPDRATLGGRVMHAILQVREGEGRERRRDEKAWPSRVTIALVQL